MRVRTIVIPLLVVPVVLAAVIWAAQNASPRHIQPSAPDGADSIVATAHEVDHWIAERWREAQIAPAEPAEDLQVLRRLALALVGTVPSLEEIRHFEVDSGPDRLLRWTKRYLDDKRFDDYFAERLSRGFVGIDQAPFLIFRRDRFKGWLAAQLHDNLPYDELVRRVISEQGLWTGAPATNFVTSAIVDGDVDENKLAGRSVRIFLGQRMDCAQCHDHPFASWKQQDFEGLAAFYGQSRLTVGGVEDKRTQRGREIEYEVEDRMTLQKRTVAPRVPFHPEWLPAGGTRREQFAAWVTHAENRRFERAAVNRTWAYVFGRPWHEPVDDMPNPPADGQRDVLDLIGRDFRSHGCDLKRMILVITSTRAFRLSSAHPSAEREDSAEYDQVRQAWGVFPLTRLRPEQVIGSMLQASSVQTIDQNSHLFTRATRFFRERDFVNEYGDLGENELREQTGTITQALQRMNGKLSREIIKGSPMNSTGRISSIAGDDEKCLDACYLVALSRHPSIEEKRQLCSQLSGKKGDERVKAVEDILWALFNSEEFAWGH